MDFSVVRSWRNQADKPAVEEWRRQTVLQRNVSLLEVLGFRVWGCRDSGHFLTRSLYLPGFKSPKSFRVSPCGHLLFEGFTQ